MSNNSSRSSSTPSVAGIITNANNERIIPATRRADGSIRPERRVRDGFVPLEDVQRYKNARVAVIEQQTALNKKKLEAARPKTKAQIKNEKRKAKKQEKREKNLEEEDGSSLADNEEKDEDIDRHLSEERQDYGESTIKEKKDLDIQANVFLSQGLENLTVTSVEVSTTLSSVKTQKGTSNPIETAQHSTRQATSEDTNTVSQMDSLKKRVKALEKKIRQIEQLVQRQEAGESLNSDQLEKIERLTEFRDELQRIKDGKD
ncbi:12024_t:CDS:1 [Ambispora leptoticha]|uniref:12024_t:CDS:1 n=1 Tax=Ambispora leptoticha TaxID=144679 RepID=A0A9N8VWW3_9GLOM|nr:12024_t:CDS:1 [Ambispora leptoticha]